MKGISNPSDMMTKAVNREKLEKYMMMVSQTEADGRAKEGLQLKREDGREEKS